MSAEFYNHEKDALDEAQKWFSELCPKAVYESYGGWRRRIAKTFGISPRLVESIQYREVKDLKAQQYKQIRAVYKAAKMAEYEHAAAHIQNQIRVGDTINDALFGEIKGLVSQFIP